MKQLPGPQIIDAAIEAFHREGAGAVLPVVDAPLASIWELEGDKVTTVRSFFTWEEALEAVGIER